MPRLILDGGLPVDLAAELRARGRDAAHVSELGFESATDAEVLAADGILVSTVALPGAVEVRGNVREAVHRHAHEMRPGRRFHRVNGVNPIEIRGVVKQYGPITAVNGLDVTVPEGTCVGLLGPNGAGKSTTMRMLTGQTVADEGTVHVLGHELPGDSKAARRKMGVVPQLDNLDIELTVEQTFAVFAQLYGIKDRAEAIERALAIGTLTDRRSSKVDKLSGGMRRRLLIARGLLHRPQLVLLDEPTVGLDPQVRQELWGLIDSLRAEGVSILMSTHYIEEAERLADTVLIMNHGQAVAEGRPSDLVRQHVGERVTEVYGPKDHLERVEADARGRGLGTRRTGTSVAVFGEAEDGVTRPGNLEDVFVALTGETVE